MKNFLLSVLLAVTTLTTFAQCPGGVTPYGAADDMTITGAAYGHAAGYPGVSWYPAPDSVVTTNYPYYNSYQVYQLSRSENPGKLTVHATNADTLSVSFGINFPNNGIDLSGAATMSIDVDNSAQPTTPLYFTAVLTDVNGYQLTYMADTLSLYQSFYTNYNFNYKKQFTDTLSASDSTVLSSSYIGDIGNSHGNWPALGQSQYSTANAKQTVIFDFKNAWSINPGPSTSLPAGQTDNYPCSSSPYIVTIQEYAWYCPALTHSLFDMKHVKTISFYFNSEGVLHGKLTNPDLVGKFWNIDYPVFNGTVLLDNFTIGACDSVPPQCNVALSVDTFTNVSCSGVQNGSIVLSETGATAPYTYNMNGEIQQSNIFSGLSPGNYTIIIADANGCRDTVSQTITQTLFNVFIKADTSSCSSPTTDSLLTAVVSGGTAPYQYSWTILGNSAGDTQSIKYTGNSEYVVSVIDANGCTATTKAFIYLPGIIINTYQANDSLYVVPSGGKPPYTSYSWQVTSQAPNSGYPLINVPVISTNPYCIIDSAAYYTVTVTDAASCWTATTFPASAPVATYNLKGDVSNYNNQSSKVYLLTLANDSSVTVLDSLMTTGPSFQFSNIYDTSVYVYYVPDTSSSPFSLPTYYANIAGTTFFNNASLIVFHSRDTAITFASITGADDGASSLEGAITSNTNQRAAFNFRTAPTGSVAGIKMVLVDSLGNSARVSVTDASGNFYFHKLKAGNYTLWVDQPFFPNDKPPVVSITSTANNQSGQFILTSTSLQRVSSVTSITGAATTSAITAYPNPTTGNVTINSPEAGQVVVYNTLGELITTLAVQAGNTTIPLGNVPTGIYTVLVTGQNNTYTPIKIVKN